MDNFTPNLMVEDVDATVEWYARVLGAQEVVKVPYARDPARSQWAMVKCGDAALMFQLRASLEKEVPALAGVPIGGSLTLYARVENVTALYGELREKAEIVQDMHSTFYGTREFAIRDCNGYVLVFSQEQK